jgi:hypothetical protein
MPSDYFLKTTISFFFWDAAVYALQAFAATEKRYTPFVVVLSTSSGKRGVMHCQALNAIWGASYPIRRTVTLHASRYNSLLDKTPSIVAYRGSYLMNKSMITNL